jgi:hypothetical protein
MPRQDEPAAPKERPDVTRLDADEEVVTADR